MAKLALDTATEALSVTVIDDADRVLGHTSLAAGKQHGERVGPVAGAESPVRTRSTSQSCATRCIQVPVLATRADRNQIR